ncbi:cytochrome C assembly family protein [Gallaecimonas pentaromativorans]|uniref:cytochrome C assembly family protein n=1 Tax=Gallaecimonas pentaromativorans TaxID=584787 RepID=UPI00067EE2F8|nr:cytochrome c biogenesis protein CcsA [Gallaecimonas pentaromativorans]MED5526397.1 cytochrome c biogenesis protein CcsA [Pseudomonadota bacterium]
MLTSIFSLLAAVLYALSAILAASRLFAHAGPNRVHTVSLGFAAAGAHLASLMILITTGDGENLGVVNVASMSSWVVVMLMTSAAVRLPVLQLMPIVHGFASLVVLAAWLVPVKWMLHLRTEPEVVVHITLSLIAYAIMVIAALYALEMAFIRRQLKSRRLSALPAFLPPLMTVERQLFQLMLVGLIVLSLALGSGFVFLGAMFAKATAHKTVLSLMAWVVYAGALYAHYRHGWRGKGAVWACLAGAFLLTLAYFGSRFVQEVILRS